MELNVHQTATLSALIGFLLFCNSLDLHFCLDDDAAITGNPDLLGNASWLNLLKNDFWGKLISDRESHKSYRPLTVATFRLNYMLHELRPLGYHLVNVLLHSAVCYLYVLLCGVILSEVWPSLIAGLLFAVHPIHTEAVSGLVGRADIMSAIFTFAALHCYRKSLEARQNAHSVIWFLITLLSTLCGALCKEIGITATVLCLAYELILHRQVPMKTLAETLRAGKMSKSHWACAARALGLGLFSITFFWMRIMLNQGPPLFHVDNNPALGFPTPLRQLHWSYLCVLNVWLLLSPSQLCAEYAMGTIPPIASPTDPRNLLTLATFASLLSIGCYAMSSRDGHHRKLLFGLCLMSIPFIPASNLIFPVGFVIAERVLYIPSMGFCMIVAYGAWLLISNRQSTLLSNVTKLGIVYLLLTQSFKTYTRNWDWKDNLTLFSSALRVSKTSAKMWNFVGNTYLKAGNTSLAEPFFVKSIEVEPLFTPAHVNMVRVLKRKKKFEEAIEQASHAAKLIVQGIKGENPHSYDKKVFLELARLLLLFTNRYEEALKWSKLMADQKPDWEASYDIMGKVLIKLGKYSKAKVALTKALELKEDYAGAHVSLGEVHLELGELEGAEVHFRRAMALDRQDFLNQFSLVKLILDHSAAHTTNRLTEALTIAFDLLLVEPKNGNLTLAIALLYYNLGETSLALEYLDQTAEIHPNDSSVFKAKGRLYHHTKRYKEAEDSFIELERLAPNAIESILFIRGTNYLAMKDYEKAQLCLAAALQSNPDDESTLVNYGIALIHTKEYTKALELFRRLTEEHPHHAAYSKQVMMLENKLREDAKSTTSSSIEVTSSSNDTS